MTIHRRRTTTLIGLALTVVGVGTALAVPQDNTSNSPSTSRQPHVVPTAEGVHTRSMLTVLDDASRQDDAPIPPNNRFAGIPDGIGLAPKPGSNNYFAYVNHELSETRGRVRDHGEIGSFVDRIEIDPSDDRVVGVTDLIKDVRYWNYTTETYQAGPNVAGADTPDSRPDTDGEPYDTQRAPLNRWCSSSITEFGQLYNDDTGRGTRLRVYFGNEEGGDNSRTFGVTEDGIATQLPRLGLFSWENTLAAYNESDTTLVMGNEDTGFTPSGTTVPGGQLWAYVGKKQRTGTTIERAGLNNGENFVIDLKDEATSTDNEFRAKYDKHNPRPFDLAFVDWDAGSTKQNQEARDEGMSFNRIEDGVWDPDDEDTFYFLVTAGFFDDTTTPPTTVNDGQLWKLEYKDIERPQRGGKLELLLDGSEPIRSNAASELGPLNNPDNITIRDGNLLIQEDPGNDPRLARVLAYRTSDGALTTIGEFKPANYAETPTEDEESSGIIDASEYYGLGDDDDDDRRDRRRRDDDDDDDDARTGAGVFLLDTQIHSPTDPEAVEAGQLLKLTVDSWDAVYGSSDPGQDDDD